MIVGVLVFHLFGYFAVFKAMQFNVKKQIKTAIKQGVPESELASFRLPSNRILQEKMGIRWKEDHEFSYKGNMYDVVNTQTDGDFVILKCINDTQEKTLFAGLENQVKSTMNTEQTKSKTLNILQKFNLLYYTQKTLHLEKTQNEFQFAFKFHPAYYYNLNQDVITPPPQFS